MSNGRPIERALRHIDPSRFPVYGQRWASNRLPSGPSECRSYSSTLTWSGGRLRLSAPVQIPLPSLEEDEDEDEDEEESSTTSLPSPYHTPSSSAYGEVHPPMSSAMHYAYRYSTRTNRGSYQQPNHSMHLPAARPRPSSQASTRRLASLPPRHTLQHRRLRRTAERSRPALQSNHYPDMLPHNSFASSSRTPLSQSGSALQHQNTNTFANHADQFAQFMLSHNPSHQLTLHNEQATNGYGGDYAQNNINRARPLDYPPDYILPVGIPPSTAAHQHVYPYAQQTSGFEASWNNYANMPTSQPMVPPLNPGVPRATAIQEPQSGSMEGYFAHPGSSQMYLHDPAALSPRIAFPHSFSNASAGGGLNYSLPDPDLDQSVLFRDIQSYDRTRRGGPSG